MKCTLQFHTLDLRAWKKKEGKRRKEKEEETQKEKERRKSREQEAQGDRQRRGEHRGREEASPEAEKRRAQRQRRGEHRGREEASTEAEAYMVDVPSSLATNINWASTMCQALFVSVKQLLPSKRLIFCWIVSCWINKKLCTKTDSELTVYLRTTKL